MTSPGPIPRVSAIDRCGLWSILPSAVGLLRRADVFDDLAALGDRRPSTTLSREWAAGNAQVGVLTLDGVLAKGWPVGGTSTVAIRRDLQRAVNDRSLVAILLHVDSPGGLVAGMASLAADIRAAA